MQSKFIKEINKMETLNYKVLEGTGYNGYILKDAPVKVMQFGEGNFLRAFVDYFYDIANEKAGYNGKVKLVQPIGNFPQMADWINEQEGLYTLYLRGSEKGQKVDAKRVISCVSTLMASGTRFWLWLALRIWKLLYPTPPRPALPTPRATASSIRFPPTASPQS
jgi:hypothetical protein